MAFPNLTWVWVTSSKAINLDLVTTVTVQEGSVRLWTIDEQHGPLCTLTGDDAARFLSWFNRRAASSLDG
jgi:hypothetical protein